MEFSRYTAYRLNSKALEQVNLSIESFKGYFEGINNLKEFFELLGGMKKCEIIEIDYKGSIKMRLDGNLLNISTKGIAPKTLCELIAQRVEGNPIIDYAWYYLDSDNRLPQPHYTDYEINSFNFFVVHEGNIVIERASIYRQLLDRVPDDILEYYYGLGEWRNDWIRRAAASRAIYNKYFDTTDTGKLMEHAERLGYDAWYEKKKYENVSVANETLIMHRKSAALLKRMSWFVVLFGIIAIVLMILILIKAN